MENARTNKSRNELEALLLPVEESAKERFKLLLTVTQPSHDWTGAIGR